MGDATEVESYDRQAARRMLVLLHFGEDLQGSNYLSAANKDSIDRTVHYGDQLFVSKSPLTLGGLIDTDPEYVRDACTRAMADEKEMPYEDFLASFLTLLVKNHDKMKLSRDISRLGTADTEKFTMMARNYLLTRQIPALQLYTAVGIYVLQKAHDQGIIERTDSGIRRRELAGIEQRV